MTTATSSPLLKILGIGAALAAFIIIVHFSTRDKTNDTVESADRTPTVPTVSGDLDETSETIRTLSAQITQLQGDMQSLSEQNQNLQLESQQLRENVVRQEEEKARTVEEQNRQANSLVDQIAGRLDSAWQQPQTVEGTMQPEVPQSKGPRIVWIAPLGQSLSTPQPQNATQAVSFTDPVKETIPTVLPVHTIPDNATLTDSTLMTALVGRVPVGNNDVTDPFPFKVIFGAENLASNGIKIPGVVGMVASGTTVGDWTLSCVRGKVTSMTFTFEDGTISTIKDKGDLAYISDPMGVPCVTGQRISNASNYLAGRMVAAAAQGIAESFSRASVDQQIGLFGGEASNVKKPGQLAISSMAVDASRELKDYLEDRLAQTFDAVYVAPGAKVALHIEEEIPIDFNPNGRKVFHGDVQSTAAAPSLD